MKILRWVLFLAVFAVAGCGSVEWFPQYVRQPTTPDSFTFPSKTGVEENVPVTSDPITVSGLTAATSPIRITGGKYQINGTGDFTDVEGTVKNTDTVVVQHTSANAIATSVTTTLTIGDVSGTFTSTTKTVAIPVFPSATATSQGQSVVSSPVTIQASGGTHKVSVVNGAYALGTNAATNFTSITQSLGGLNGVSVFLRVNAPRFGQSTSAHLFIDNVQSSFTVTTQ